MSERTEYADGVLFDPQGAAFSIIEPNFPEPR
jgi:hypothetical protein